MGIAYNTSIVTDGLVFNLDAANVRSYSGSGNTAFSLYSGIGASLTNGVGFGTSNFGYFIFDGTNDTIICGDVCDILDNNWTVSVWIKTSLNHFGRLVSKNNIGPDGWFLSLETSGNISIGINSVWSSFASSYNTNTWTNIVGVWNRSSNALIYQDNVLLGSFSIASQTASLNTSFNLRLSSRDAGGGFYNGNIANAQIYNRALSAAEVKQNYNALRDRFGI